ncbi:MAG TPA: hypothetical protein VJ063_22200 [Verrucomicrobiae bacterium]|nr:hypothetical protein [Verrucomicrobiae bacterium]
MSSIGWAFLAGFAAVEPVDPIPMLSDNPTVKIVGKRRIHDDLEAISPEEALRRASVLQAQADLLNPYPRPRGFVFKAKTREDYERWRKAQSNPRLW